MSKCIFIILALFGLNAFAEMHSNMGESNSGSMMSGAEMKSGMSEDGLMGSFSLRYQNENWAGADQLGDELSYRARVGWKGEVNEAVKYGISVSTVFENSFDTELSDLKLDQAYVSYSPVEGLYIMAGKMGWIPDFNKVGVFWSEQLYLAGAGIKYKHKLENDGKVYVKLAVYNEQEVVKEQAAQDAVIDPETGEEISPAKPKVDAGKSNELLVMGKVGAQFNTSDVETGVFAGATYDNGLLAEEGATAKTVVQAGLNVGSSSMLPVAVGLFGLGSANTDAFGDSLSWNAGVYVGNAGKADSAEMGDFGLSVSYYDIDPNGITSAKWLNEDYVNGSEDKGIAARAQYNAWDNVSLAVKLAYSTERTDDKINAVGELMFLF